MKTVLERTKNHIFPTLLLEFVSEHIMEEHNMNSKTEPQKLVHAKV